MICYKFTTAQYAFWTLFDKRIKASRPNEFNDPFEFCPVSEPNSVVRWMKYDPQKVQGLYEIASKDGYENSFDEFKANDFERIATEKFHLALPHLEKWDRDAREKASEYVGIICLSRHSPESSFSYPLWSHYADFHKGCAIGIDVQHKCFERARLNDDVSYVKERPSYVWDLEFSNKQAHLDQLYKISKTKSDAWEYEREYRLAFPLKELELHGGHYLVPIHPQAVRCVIYGEFIDEVFKNRIEHILKHPDFSNVDRLQVQRDSHSYSLVRAR